MMPVSPKVQRLRPQTPRLLKRDLRTLTVFIEIYCRHQHANQQPFEVKGFNLKELAGHHCQLCPDCSKLLAHALVKRSHCPQDPKPMCKHCPNHCYQTGYREKIREVMRFSGKKLLWSGRLDYLLHLYF